MPGTTKIKGVRSESQFPPLHKAHPNQPTNQPSPTVGGATRPRPEGPNSLGAETKQSGFFFPDLAGRESNDKKRGYSSSGSLACSLGYVFIFGGFLGDLPRLVFGII